MVFWTPLPLLIVFLKLKAAVGVSIYPQEVLVVVLTLTLITAGGAMVWEYPDADSAWITAVRSKSWPV